MAQKRWLRRLETGALAAGISLTALGAVQVSGVPDLTAGLLIAGSFFTDPAAAISAADRMFEQSQTAAAPVPQPIAPTPQPSAAPEPTPAPAAAPESGQGPTAQPPPLPPPETPPENAGQIVERHYPQGEGDLYIRCGAGTIKNNTSLSGQKIRDAVDAGMPFTIDLQSSEPQVLIMHTHTTESFELTEKDWYDPAYTARRTDLALNMAAVGEKIAEQLNGAGIVTLHDTTLHDYPSYNGSYQRSSETVQQYLAQYPSIKVVLDVHRDAIEPRDGQRVSAVAQIGERKAAQVMIICGADKNGNLPNFKKNLGFAAAWQNAMESRFPGLTRPVLFDYRYYNQDLTTGSLLIEVGSHGNSLEQACYSGELIGNALVGLFTTGA